MTYRLLLLVAALLLAGCSEGQITKTKDDVRIWLHEAGFASGGEDAIVGGVVAYDRGAGCMYLESGDTRSPVIWPSGTRIVSTDPVVLSSGGERFAVGDRVTGGGGWHDYSRHADLIPPECRGDSQVARFNSGSSIEVSNQ